MDILERIYQSVSSLEDFLKDLNGCPPFSSSKDKAGYIAFLQSTLVGIPSCHSSYQGPLDYKQYSDQTEVINRVMLRLQRQGKFGKNVLLNGFSSWRSEGGFAGIPSLINIPNNNSNQLRIPYWSKLLSRIGDELMMHILENLSVFTSAPPSCYIQLTGIPASMLITTAQTSIPSPTKQCTIKEWSTNQKKKSCQFEDADRGSKVDQNEPPVIGQCDDKGRIVRHKRKRDEVDGDNDEDANITKARKIGKGTCQRMQSRPRKEVMNRTKGTEGTEDPKDVEDMITGLERSYYILNACYSRTVGRTWLKHDLLAKLPASNSGAQTLTQHIFNSTENGSRTSSKTDKTPSPDGNEKEDTDRQGEDKGKKKKKPQRTCRRLIKVQALLKTFLIQHRKLKFRSILNHHCPLKLPLENPDPDQTNTRPQECSEIKLPQRSRARKTSIAPSSSIESVSGEKSLAELREESKLEGYSPKVFHRRRPKLCDLSNARMSSAEQFNGKGLVASVDDERERIEKRARDGPAQGLTKTVRGDGREGLSDRRGSRGTGEGMEDVGGNEVGEVEPRKSIDVELGVNEKQKADCRFHAGYVTGIEEAQSPRIRMEMDGNATSSTVHDDVFLDTSRDSIPSLTDRRLSRKTNSKTETGMQLPSDEVSADDDDAKDNICSQPDKRLREETNLRTKPLLSSDALREACRDSVQSHPDGRIEHRTNSKTMMQLPSNEVTIACEAKKDIIINSMQTECDVKIKKRTNTRSKKGMRLPSDAATLIKMKTEPWQVCLFLRQVLLKVVPDELWGSVHNRNVFFKGVKKFVQLGRFEKLSLRELIEEIRVEDCDWCQLEKFRGREPPFTSLVKQHQLVTDFFHWLLIAYTIPLIMMCFYVTETSSSRNQLVFYRKPVWLLLEKLGIQYYVANGIMKPIKESDAGKLVAASLTLGFSRLRFVPKTKSLRPITRMGRSVIEEKKGLSVRLLLQDLFDVLTYHKMHQPSVLGCSLLGIDGIYDKVLSFIQDRKGRSDTRPLYFVKIDIEKCYDSIKQSKLHQIISMLLQGHDKPDEYQIHRYIIVTKAASGGFQKISQRHVTTKLSLAGSFHRQLIQMAQCGDIKNAIIINQVHTVKVTPTALLQRLKQHVMADVVKIGRKYYWRQNGISQGSILSSLLCSFFYAHLERCYLSDIDQEGLMMRLIDDFILITPHLDKAQRFLQLLLSGVKQYGCSANPSKTLANFDFMFDGQLVSRSTERFPWCGVVFNTQTLNISNDYTKYNNVSIRYTLTICTDNDTSLHYMRTKLTWSLKAKNVSIFMDPQINSFRTIVINVYHLLLLLAYRFHSYYHCLTSSIRQNTPPLQFYSIWASCVRTFHASVSKLRQDNHANDETTFPLTLNTVNWIGLKAFDTKLSKHRGLYHPLIKLVRKHRRKAASKMGKAMQEVLEEMTSPALPEDFMKMRR